MHYIEEIGEVSPELFNDILSRRKMDTRSEAQIKQDVHDDIQSVKSESYGFELQKGCGLSYRPAGMSTEIRVIESHIDENGNTVITKFEPVNVSPVFLENHDPDMSLSKLSKEEIDNILDIMKGSGKIVPFSDEKPNKKYTEGEMKMALTYQWATKEPASIEEIDKMLNDLGTNE